MSVVQGGEHEEPQRSGLDPEVPQVLTTWQVTGPVLVGHTASLDDPDAPIVIRKADTVLPGPDGTGYAEGRCGRCVAKPFMARGDGRTVLILQHERRCSALDGLLRLAGVTP